MIRMLSAIGMSRYTSQQAIDEYVSQLLTKDRMRGQHYIRDGRVHVELFKEMGPFQLVLRGSVEPEQYIRIGMICPALKEKRGYELIGCEVHEDNPVDLYLFGQEKNSLEGLCLRLTEIHRFFKEEGLLQKEKIFASCYGLSYEGRVLLGIERTEEDMAIIAEGEAARRNLLSRALEGDESAFNQIQEEEEQTQQEIEERLHHEDVYSIFDGFLYPVEGDFDNYYTILGDILYVEKLMNSVTEEWVYYLELNVLGQILRVCINPRDLLGEPQPGFRFMGRASFFGRIEPARQLLENPHGFY